MQVNKSEEGQSERVEIVCFTIEEQDFCIDISHVLEIRGWTNTTVLPHAPDYVMGMMNLRGTVLPVIDLSLRLGFGKTEPSARHVIIIAQIEDKVLGFLVDAVSDIISVNMDDMQSTPDVSSGRTSSFIKGVFPQEKRLIRAIEAKEVLPSGQVGEVV